MKKEAVKGDNGENREEIFNWAGVILFGIFLLIGIVFYASLSIVKSGEISGTGTGNVALGPGEGNFDFGIGEILFALAFAGLMTGFSIWTKSVIAKNAYLGTIIGIVGAAVFGYGFYLRYRGFYSTLFMAVTGIVILGYLGMNFFKYKKEDKFDAEEFEEA